MYLFGLENARFLKYHILQNLNIVIIEPKFQRLHNTI
jgi:hypothetical protein